MHTFKYVDDPGYEVGFYQPKVNDGVLYYDWRLIACVDTASKAAALVSYLNGGSYVHIPEDEYL